MTSQATPLQEAKTVRFKKDRLLVALLDGPKVNRELQDVADDVGPYISRDMARYRREGLVENRRPGARALYALTEAGKARAVRFVSAPWGVE